MKKLILLLLLATSFAFAQSKKSSTYNYGYNGLELIVKNSNTTIIVSTFNSKKEIKDDIAQKVYEYFREKTVINGEQIVIFGKDAIVTGKFYCNKKGKLTSLSFHYEKISWNNGLTEIHANSTNDFIKKTPNLIVTED